MQRKLEILPGAPDSANELDRIAVCELFDSIQGEGPRAGTPATFLRLAGCNLQCSWCDTKYSWSPEELVSEQWSTADLKIVLQETVRSHLVVTGGEPLLQQAALVEALRGVSDLVDIEVETNGTILPRKHGLLERVRWWSVSPKLASSGMLQPRRRNDEALEFFRRHEGAVLKLVVTRENCYEASSFAQHFGWPKSRVWLMPQASTREEFANVGPAVAQFCVRYGFRFSPRLQLSLWNGEKGR